RSAGRTGIARLAPASGKGGRIAQDACCHHGLSDRRPSHIDLYDMKPGAPADIRGDFRPIQTKVPGFQICEHMPLQAAIADKLALVRSVHFVEPMEHELQEIFTGFPKASRRPAFGAVLSRFRSATHRQVPAYASVTPSYPKREEVESPQYIGSAHRPLLLGSEGVKDLGLADGVSIEQLQDRRRLLATFDNLLHDLDAASEFAAMDAFTARALDLVSSPRAREAFDLQREPEEV